MWRIALDKGEHELIDSLGLVQVIEGAYLSARAPNDDRALPRVRATWCAARRVTSSTTGATAASACSSIAGAHRFSAFVDD